MFIFSVVLFVLLIMTSFVLSTDFRYLYSSLSLTLMLLILSQGWFYKQKFFQSFSITVFLSPSTMADTFTGHSSLGQHPWLLRAQCTLLQCPLAFKVSTEKSAVRLSSGLSFIFDLRVFLLQLSYCGSVFWSCLFGVLCTSCIHVYFSPQFGEVFFYDPVEDHLVYAIGLGFFSVIYAYNLKSQVPQTLKTEWLREERKSPVNT